MTAVPKPVQDEFNAALDQYVGEWMDGLRAKLGDTQKADWDESKHPRAPAGSPGGGEFTSGGGAGRMRDYEGVEWKDIRNDVMREAAIQAEAKRTQYERQAVEPATWTGAGNQQKQGQYWEKAGFKSAQDYVDSMIDSAKDTYIRGEKARLKEANDPKARLANALQQYTEDVIFDRINTSLRSGSNLMPGDEKIVKAMDAGLQANKLKDETTLYRAVEGVGIEQFDRLDTLAGKTVTLSGYQSASKSQAAAKEFLEGNDVPILMKITAPAGTPAIDVNKVLAGKLSDYNAQEKEVILGHNTSFRIDRVEKGTHFSTLHVTVVPKD
jgi:hypothetical protein